MLGFARAWYATIRPITARDAIASTMAEPGEAEQPAVVPAMDEPVKPMPISIAPPCATLATSHARELVDDHDRDGNADEESPACGPTLDGRARDGHHRILPAGRPSAQPRSGRHRPRAEPRR